MFTICKAINVLKLRLSIFKRKELKDCPRRYYIRFAVVDIERSRGYPTNFVCILPKNIKRKKGYQTRFERKFKESSVKLAKKLLKHSLKAEEDWKVKQEIRERLELLKQRPQRNTIKKRSYF
jgi:hypothetical protein